MSCICEKKNETVLALSLPRPTVCAIFGLAVLQYFIIGSHSKDTFVVSKNFIEYIFPAHGFAMHRYFKKEYNYGTSNRLPHRGHHLQS